MAKTFIVEISRLPLPMTALGKNIEYVPSKVEEPKDFSTQIEATEYAKKMIQEGYKMQIKCPEGTILSNEDILKLINNC